MTIDSWFTEPGAYVLVDGQFGSTGKGLFSALIAETAVMKPNWVTTNAGPNSGHTAYIGLDKVVTQQLPIASIALKRLGAVCRTLVNAGAIIDSKRMAYEVIEYLGSSRPYIHPCAAMIEAHHISQDAHTRSMIASTGKGTGPALIDKISRVAANIARGLYMPDLPPFQGFHGEKMRTWDDFWDWEQDRVFVETSQGFSLGLNSTFYPNVTSRECTVMQALADARIPAQMLRKVAMCVRTFPIRVGDTDRTSGGCYQDQKETSWETLGVEPELTTVTRTVRRVFTWSREQFRAACAANRPDVIFCNFFQYLPMEDRAAFVQNLHDDYMDVMERMPIMYYGFGPRGEDVVRHWWEKPWQAEELVE